MEEFRDGDRDGREGETPDAAARRPALLPDFAELVYGVVFSPRVTLRAVARRPAPPTGASLMAYGVTAFIAGLAAAGSMAASIRRLGADPAPSIGVDPSTIPGLGATGGAGLALTLGVVFLVLGLAILFVKAGILHLAGSLFGGQGRGAHLLAALGLTYVPGVLAVPINLLPAGPPGWRVISGFLLLGILAWRVALDVIAVREVHRLSTGRAAAAVLIPMGVGLLLAAVLVILGFGLLLTVFGPIFRTDFPGIG